MIDFIFKTPYHWPWSGLYFWVYHVIAEANPLGCFVCLSNGLGYQETWGSLKPEGQLFHYLLQEPIEGVRLQNMRDWKSCKIILFSDRVDCATKRRITKRRITNAEFQNIELQNAELQNAELQNAELPIVESYRTSNLTKRWNTIRWILQNVKIQNVDNTKRWKWQATNLL
jgi:hypothetical protein